MAPAPNRFEPPRAFVEDGPPTLAPQRPRYLRGSIASLVLALPWMAMLWAVRDRVGDDPHESTSHIARLVLATLLLYASVHVVGNLAIARALARRHRLRFWSFAMTVALLPLAIAIVTVPPWVLLADREVLGYQRCGSIGCHVAVSAAAAVLVYVLNVVPGVLTSLLWYAFGRPKRGPAGADAGAASA